VVWVSILEGRIGLGQAGVFISIFLGSTSCDFQWSDRATYIHEFG
jgi:hypothetical protein